MAYELELVVVEERKEMDHRSLVEMDHRSLEHRMEELDHQMEELDHRDHRSLDQNQDHKDHQSLDLLE